MTGRERQRKRCRRDQSLGKGWAWGERGRKRESGTQRERICIGLEWRKGDRTGQRGGWSGGKRGSIGDRPCQDRRRGTQGGSRRCAGDRHGRCDSTHHRVGSKAKQNKPKTITGNSQKDDPDKARTPF
jgi:hypothetical protein